jgi:hypothetical protein
VNASGDIYVADYGNNEIREVTPSGVVTTLAGSTTAGHSDGTGSAASFFGPLGVVTTLAGSPVAGSANGTGSAASFHTPFGIAVVPSSGILYVGDYANDEIRQITPGP